VGGGGVIKTRMWLSVIIIAGTMAAMSGSIIAWFTSQSIIEDNLFMAGTVAIEAESQVILSQYFDQGSGAVYLYGVEQGTGHLYEINVTANGIANKVYETPNRSVSVNWPNGLAFDNRNRRLYYAEDNSNLYFYDFHNKEEVLAGAVIGLPAGATFGNGYYWYIQNSTDNLYKVSFHPNGTIKEVILAAQSFTGGQRTFNLGDLSIDIRNSVIYGSSTASSVGGGAFFKIEIIDNNYVYSYISSVIGLQLAYGSNGLLYGHSTSTGQWSSIDPTTGQATSLFTGANKFTDLASGYISVWNPGDCTKEKYYIANTGTKSIYLRANITGQWYEFDQYLNDWAPWTPDPDEDVVTVTIHDSNWEYIDGYWYYTSAIPGTNTGPGGIVEVFAEICLDGENTDNQYQGKRFILSVVFEAIQSSHDASEYEWGWSP